MIVKTAGVCPNLLCETSSNEKTEITEAEINELFKTSLILGPPSIYYPEGNKEKDVCVVSQADMAGAYFYIIWRNKDRSIGQTYPEVFYTPYRVNPGIGFYKISFKNLKMGYNKHKETNQEYIKMVFKNFILNIPFTRKA